MVGRTPPLLYFEGGTTTEVAAGAGLVIFTLNIWLPRKSKLNFASSLVIASPVFSRTPKIENHKTLLPLLPVVLFFLHIVSASYKAAAYDRYGRPSISTTSCFLTLSLATNNSEHSLGPSHSPPRKCCPPGTTLKLIMNECI